jgi:hypothetical protein
VSTKSITIQGLAVEVLQPYVEGAVITAAEAAALNQTRAENIRNNTAKLVKDAQAELTEGEVLSDEAMTALKAAIAAYDASYVFNLGSVGAGRTVRDPIEAEAIRIAKGLVTEAIRKKGHKVKDVAKEKVAELVATVAASDKVIEAAKKSLAARSKASLLDDLDI